MPEYPWICLNKQDSQYVLGPKYAKIQNKAKFWIQSSGQVKILRVTLTLITYGFLFHFMLIGVQKCQTCPSQVLGGFFYDALKTPHQSRRHKTFKQWKHCPNTALFGLI